MSDIAFETVFADWQQRAKFLDKQLMPIVHADVDINDPDWREKLENEPHPADQSGLRAAIADLFNEIVGCFEALNHEHRQRVIDLMGENDSLMYSAVIDADYNSPDGFRKYLILFVIKDQGKDTRDAIVTLTHYRQDGEQRGIDVNEIFREAAGMASTKDKYGWGSTRDLLLNY